MKQSMFLVCLPQKNQTTLSPLVACSSNLRALLISRRPMSFLNLHLRCFGGCWKRAEGYNKSNQNKGIVLPFFENKPNKVSLGWRKTQKLVDLLGVVLGSKLLGVVFMIAVSNCCSQIGVFAQGLLRFQCVPSQVLGNAFDHPGKRLQVLELPLQSTTKQFENYYSYKILSRKHHEIVLNLLTICTIKQLQKNCLKNTLKSLSNNRKNHRCHWANGTSS